MFRTTKRIFLPLALATLCAPAARADGFGISFGGLFHHGAFGIGISTGPLWSPVPPPAPEPCPPRRWVPGHYETVIRPVYVAGCDERIWVPAEYAWVQTRWGRPVWACRNPGHYEVVRRPGRYENREVRVWVEGSWQP
jgi:hypothetical protein